MTMQKWRNCLPAVERKKILELTCECLFSKDGSEALKYLTEIRHFKTDTLKKFEIGYMPWWVKNCNDTRHEFAGRITIPIYDHYGNLIVFSSRDWRENAEHKFWHETFEKRFYLYGMQIAKPNILKHNKAIIVEGEFDVMMMHQYNFPITVGILGSAPQLQQIAILSRYCNQIYVVFDGDEGGEKALDSLVTIGKENALENASVGIIPVTLPAKNDPDDFLLKNGRTAFIELLKKSKEKYTKKRKL